MFSVRLEKVQLLRLKYFVLKEMKMHDFDPNRTDVQTYGAILDALDRTDNHMVLLINLLALGRERALAVLGPAVMIFLEGGGVAE